MRKVASLLVVVSFVFGLMSFAKPVFAGGGWRAKDWIKVQIGSPSIVAEGETIAIEAAPYIKNSRTMVPASKLLNQIGETLFEADYYMVKIYRQDKFIKFFAGARTAVVTINLPDGSQASDDFKIEVAPEIVNGIMYVPLYFVADVFGYLTSWNQKDRSIYLDLPVDTENILEPSKESVVILQVNNPVSVINGIRYIIDPAPYIKNDRTMVPVRAIVESLGQLVKYDPDSHLVEFNRGLEIVRFSTKSDQVMFQNRDDSSIYRFETLEAPPEIRNNIMYIPLRYLAELYHLDVKWEANLKKITITGNKQLITE